MSYITTQRVRHQGKAYLPGKEIELHEDEAALLGSAVKAQEEAQDETTEEPKPTRRAATKKPAASKSEGE